MAFTFRLVSVIIIVLFISSCLGDRHEVDISGYQSDVSIRRFENDLWNNYEKDSQGVQGGLRDSYGEFFDLFTHNILGIPEEPDSLIPVHLGRFVTDPDVQEIYRQVRAKYPNMDFLKEDIDLFLRYYQYYFPEKEVPDVITFISAFNYAVITTDSVIGIGLDMFLGDDSEFYPALGIPKYMSDKFRKEYIAPSVAKAWFQSDYEPDAVKREFLSQMVYYGKLFYYLDCVTPHITDTLRTGFSTTQLDWCRDNENRIWAFYIDKNLLFSKDASEYAKFINDGPGSNGFPKEAPARIGAWTGWQIVKAYMKKNSGVSLEELLEEQDALKILEESGYKPKR
jgi:gliding motility-associated lipoprotein GldB